MCLDSWACSTVGKMINSDQGIKHVAEIQGTISFGRLGCNRKNNIKIDLK